MAIITSAELKARFETGDTPNGQDFIDLIDSLLHANQDNFPNPLPAGLGGPKWRGAWDATVAYAANDLVSYGGRTYLCKVAHTNQLPTHTTYWDKFSDKGDPGAPGNTGPEALTRKGTWSSVVAYVANDWVNLSGTSYVCILGHTNQQPPNATYWDTLAAKGDKGDTGAPGAPGAAGTPPDGSITTAKLAAAAVTQSRLKTTTALTQYALPAGTAGSTLLAGGSYSWWTASADNGTEMRGVAVGGGLLDYGYVGGTNANSNQVTCNVRERYVQASPPYNLGYGDIPEFCWALVDGAGRLWATQLAQDPSWANNGPTDITPEYYRGGLAYRRYRTLAGRMFHEAMEDPGLRAAFLAGEIDPEETEIEITREFKNADMTRVPHPFARLALDGRRVLLLDPCGALAERLFRVHEDAGAGEAHEILTTALRFDNEPLRLPGPPGVLTVGARLKRTRH